MTKTPTGEWLEKKYLEWQSREGGRRTLGAFAQFLGVDRELLSRWVNGKSNPDRYSADKIAIKLDDQEIYDLLGIPRPDPRLQTIIKQWGNLPEDTKDRLLRDAESGSAAYQTDQPVAQTKRKQKV